MPLYNPPLLKPQLLMKGVPVWLLGAMNLLRGNCGGTVNHLSLTSDVATATVQINEGPIPLVGDLITVWGTSSGSGEFNVSRAAITAVSISAATNAGTISYALTGSNGNYIDSGRFLAEAAESGEALVNNSFSQACCIQAPEGDSQFTVPLAVTCPSMPTAATFTLQRAIRDIAAEYTNTATVASITGGSFGDGTTGPVVLATLERGYFYRLAVTGVSGGTNPTVIAKIG